MKTVNNKKLLLQSIEMLQSKKYRSVWDNAISEDAINLLEIIIDHDRIDSLNDNIIDRDLFKKLALNGAKNWNEFSYGGCSYVYDEDIMKHYSIPSYIKKWNGQNPSSNETWLDLQGRAYNQACTRAYRIYKNIVRLGGVE